MSLRLIPSHKIPIPDYERPTHPPRVALVLGSGGSRGLAHVGVIEELEHAGVPIDVIIGTSAGALVGAIYADCLCAEQLKKTLYTLKSGDVIDYNLWNSRYGLVTGFRLRQFLAKRLQARTFEQLKIPLIVVATDIHSGELVRLGSSHLIPALHASCAIPGVFRPVRLYGHYLVDGGVLEPVPVETAIEYGADIIIAVDICEKLSDAFPTNLFGVMKRGFEICFKKLSNYSTQHADIVIQPELKNIGTFNDKTNPYVYEAGRKAAREALPAIIEALHKK